MKFNARHFHYTKGDYYYVKLSNFVLSKLIKLMLKIIWMQPVSHVVFHHISILRKIDINNDSVNIL